MAEIVVEVEILAGQARLGGTLTLPTPTIGTVVFVHGSGSSRHSPRNRHVAGELNRAGLGTLLFDLLTRDEEKDRRNVFDIQLLAGRLSEVTRWLRARGGHGPLGYFGASTGAAAALWAAADADNISAVVSRGGRPDLAAPVLNEVSAPTLLIVGGLDLEVLELNRDALAQLRCEAALVIVPGAGHLFEEPGALDRVAEMASQWFTRHFEDDPDESVEKGNEMTEKDPRDSALERAQEEAEGTEAFEGLSPGALEREREDAQGVEVFEDPDATIPASALAEGDADREGLSGEQVGLGRDDEERHDGEAD